MREILGDLNVNWKFKTLNSGNFSSITLNDFLPSVIFETPFSECWINSPVFLYFSLPIFYLPLCPYFRLVPFISLQSSVSWHHTIKACDFMAGSLLFLVSKIAQSLPPDVQGIALSKKTRFLVSFVYLTKGLIPKRFIC